MTDQIVRKLELIRKYDGSEAALLFFDKMHKWGKTRPEVLLQVAKAKLSLGQTDEAAFIIDGIADERALEGCIGSYRANADFKKEIFLLKDELAGHKIDWKTFAELLPIPGKYKLYILPMGNPDMELIRKTVPLVEEHLGCRVHVLPKVPLPDDPVCYWKNRAQYEAHQVQQRIKRLYPLPNDAIAFAGVTNEDLFRKELTYEFFSLFHGNCLISHARWYGSGTEHTLAAMLAKSLCAAILDNARIPVCIHPLCIGSNSGSPQDHNHKRFALCPSCQKSLKGQSAEKIFRYLHSRWPSNTSFLNGDTRELDDAYRKVLLQAETEAKWTFVDEPGNPVCLPSMQMPGEQEKGLRRRYFKIDLLDVQDIASLDKLDAESSTIAGTFDIEDIEVKNRFGLVFEGLIKIPEDGCYQFFLSSDSAGQIGIGDRILINREQTRDHWTQTCDLHLQAGFHKIRAAYISGERKPLFTVYLRSSQMLGQKVPAELLYHNTDQ